MVEEVRLFDEGYYETDLHLSSLGFQCTSNELSGCVVAPTSKCYEGIFYGMEL